MWGKTAEIVRLVKLRKNALKAFSGNPPLKNNIRLPIKFILGPKNNKQN